MDEDFLAYLDFCVAQTEYIHESLVWGEDMGNWESHSADSDNKKDLKEELWDFPLPY